MKNLRFTYRSISQYFAIGFLLVLIITGIFGPLFTSNVPWKITENGENSYPAATRYFHKWGIKQLPSGWMTKNWKNVDSKVDNLIPYDPGYIDLQSVGAKSPGINGHILGTDLLGRDLLAGLISGANVSIRVALLSTVGALIIGYLLVFFTSYIGDDRIKLNLIQLPILFLIISMLYYYLFIAFSQIGSSFFWTLAKVLLFLTLAFLSLNLIQKGFKNSQIYTFNLKLDALGVKIYEIFFSIPKLIILLILIGVINNNGGGREIISLSLILSLLLWPIFYRHLRLEILREKSTDFYVSLKNLGLHDVRIALVHFIPISFRAIVIPLIFVFSATILAEATLSFLGLGLSDEWMSWGRILSQARQRMSAWWLVIFPGVAIFLTLYSLNILAKAMNKT